MLYVFVQRCRERIKGYKTIVANALIGIPGALFYLYEQFLASGVDVSTFIPAKYIGLTMAGLAILGVVMRIYTTGALGSKEGLPAENGPVDNIKEPI